MQRCKIADAISSPWSLSVASPSGLSRPWSSARRDCVKIRGTASTAPLVQVVSLCSCTSCSTASKTSAWKIGFRLKMSPHTSWKAFLPKVHPLKKPPTSLHQHTEFIRLISLICDMVCALQLHFYSSTMIISDLYTRKYLCLSKSCHSWSPFNVKLSIARMFPKIGPLCTLF